MNCSPQLELLPAPTGTEELVIGYGQLAQRIDDLAAEGNRITTMTDDRPRGRWLVTVTKARAKP